MSLDAYGHMSFTVGNSDWVACFDAERRRGFITYHVVVVVDCESGGFTDTIQKAAIPVSDVATLFNLPEMYADMCFEMYADSRKREHRVGIRQTRRTMKAWRAHLEALAR
jgi:hypothetical protein